MLGIVDSLFQIPDLFFKKEAGNRRLNVFRNPCYRSVRAVTAAKSIIYKKVCPFCQLFGELRIVLLFTRMKTDILDRKSTRLNSSHVAISYAVFCLKKKNG